MKTLKTGKTLMGSIGMLAVIAATSYVLFYPTPVQAQGRIVYGKHQIHVYGHVRLADGAPFPNVRIAMFREFDKVIHGKRRWEWVFANGTFTNKAGAYSIFAPVHNPNGVRLEMFRRGTKHPIILHTWGLKHQQSGAFDMTVTEQFGALATQTFVY